MEKNYPENDLYHVNKEVRCIKCGHKGAIQFYGKYYSNGMGSKVDEFTVISLEKYRDNPKMDYAIGFGGTIPFKCTNCDNFGLIDFGGLEGYEMAFETIERT